MSEERGTDPLLCDIAWRAIGHGLRLGYEATFDGHALPEELLAPGASFVTLKTQGRLRGCVGNLHPQGSLAESVHHNAYAAAFHDPRFAPLTAEELDALEVSISVLSALTPIESTDETRLLETLRPGVDGLLIRRGPNQATFLPQVWSQMPDARAFLTALKRKARLAPDARGYQAWRYGCRVVPCGPASRRPGASPARG